MKLSIYQDPKLVDFLIVSHQMPEDERTQYEAFTGKKFDPERISSVLHQHVGPAWVITAGGEPVFIAGFDMIRPGVWQDWLLSTPSAWDTHWRGVTRICRRAMDSMLQSGAHRLQCVSLASRIHAHRWYRPLGLTLEGTLRGYGVNGEDALMFSRTRSPDGQ